MAAIVFPLNPVVGTATGTFTQGGVTYTYDGTKWNVGIGTPVDLTSAQTITGAKTFGTMSYTGAFTGSTGIINIGAGQLYKDAAGNIGIGTVAPWSMFKLDVTQSTADKSSIIARINSVRTTAGYNYGIVMNNTSATANNYTAISNRDSTGTDNAWIEFTNVVHSAATPQGAIGFNTRNGVDYTRKMTIDMNGNVGIGTSSPAQKLHISSSTATGTIQLGGTSTTGYYSQISQNANFLDIIANGDQAYRTSVATNNGTGNIRFFTAGMTVGNTERMCIDTQGRVTTPYQPAFYAYGSGYVALATDTTQITGLNLTTFNIGNCYNTTSNVFTAQVAGTYLFTAAIRFDAMPAGNYIRLIILKNNFNGVVGAASGGSQTIIGANHATDYHSLTISVVLNLAVNEFVCLAGGRVGGLGSGVLLSESSFTGVFLG